MPTQPPIAARMKDVRVGHWSRPTADLGASGAKSLEIVPTIRPMVGRTCMEKEARKLGSRKRGLEFQETNNLAIISQDINTYGLSSLELQISTVSTLVDVGDREDRKPR